MEASPEYDLDTLKAYLRGELDEALHQQIKLQATQSEALATIIEGLKFAMTERGGAGIDAYLEETGQRQQERIGTYPKKKQANSRLGYALAAAVSLLIVAGVLLLALYPKGGSPELLVQGYLVTPYRLRDIPTRGGPGGSATESGGWRESYRQADYTKVVALLPDEGPLTEEETFFLALSHLYQGETATARVLLGRVVAMGHATGYEEQARWYLALACLKGGDEGQALQLLKNIRDRKGGHYRRAGAEELLKRF